MGSRRKDAQECGPTAGDLESKRGWTYRAFSEVFGTICFQELSLSNQLFVGAGSSHMLSELSALRVPTSSTGNCPRKPVLAWSRLGCSRKSIPREQPGLFNLSIARIIPHI